MTRRRLVVLALAPTLLLGLVLGGFLIVDARSQRAEVERADAVAERYQDRLGAYRRAVAQDLEEAGDTDPLTVSDVLDEHRDEIPELDAVPERAALASSGYETARRTEAAVAESRRVLTDVIEATAQAPEFVAAAEQALALQPNELAPQGAVPDGGPLRASLLPPLRAALATFEQAPVPEGAEPAATAVRAALKHVIDEAERLAAELDAGRSGSFGWQSEYQAAADAVQAYDDGVRADLREALDGLLASDAT